jgi:hypothetical protein
MFAKRRLACDRSLRDVKISGGTPGQGGAKAFEASRLAAAPFADRPFGQLRKSPMD